MAWEAVYDLQEKDDLLDESLEQIRRFSIREHWGYFNRMQPKKVGSRDFEEPVPSPERRQGRNRTRLTLNEKLEISQLVLVDYIKYKDVAKQYRVSVNRVCQLIHRIKRKPNMLSELVAKN